MKYKLLVLLTSICLLLSACSGDSISSSESPSSAITTSSACDAVNSYSSDDSFSALTESTLDIVGEPAMAYLNTYNLKPKYTDFPLKAPDYRAVSCMENNDDNIYKCFSENYINTIYTKRITEPLKYVLYAKDYYSSDSTDYNLIPDDSVILTSDSPLITKSNTKVKYVNYLLDDSEIPEENWIDYFSEQLCNYDSPVMIKEAYTYKANDITYEFVVASNVVDIPGLSPSEIHENFFKVYTSDNCPYTPETLKSDNSIIYRCECLFINGVPAEKLKLNIIKGPYKNSLDFSPDSFDNGFVMPFYAYEYNDYNEITKCPVFFNNIYEQYSMFELRGSPLVFFGNLLDDKLKMVCYHDDGLSITRKYEIFELTSSGLEFVAL